jgi:Flp pilus assembly protein TadG
MTGSRRKAVIDRWRGRFLRGARPFHAGEAGNVSVELALLSPILLLIMLGVVEYGRAYSEQLSLSRLARAQLQYAVENLAASSVIDEIEARSKTMPNGDRVTLTAARICSCLGATSDCFTTCDGTSLPDMLVQVTASRDLTPLVFFPGHSGALAISAITAMRVR